MATYTKNYSIEWMEKCEANSFDEAEKIMDAEAERNPDKEINMSSQVEKL